jgi:hypothetical protein
MMLRHQPLSQWVERFKQHGRMTPTDIVLPAVGYTGPTFSSRLQPAPTGLGSGDPFRRWVAEAREFLGDRTTVWANVILDFTFLESEHLTVCNQYGDHLSQTCITNPVSQAILGEVLEEVLDSGVDGLVLDAVDILPNAQVRNMADVSVTCFCDSCLDALRENGFNSRLDRFMGLSSIFSLVLKTTETGTDHIDPSRELIEQRDARTLVSTALARGFVNGEEGELLDRATALLQYCEARGKVTASSLRKLTSVCQAKERRSAVILGSVQFDQSQQVTVEDISLANAADEVWVCDAGSSKTYDIPLLCYLAARSSYSINAFFEVVETANEVITSASLDSFLGRLAHTSKRLGANRFTAASAYVAHHSPNYVGFVGVPLFQDDHLAIVESLTTEVTGGALPTHILDQFRIAAGAPTVLEE